MQPGGGPGNFDEKCIISAHGMIHGALSKNSWISGTISMPGKSQAVEIEVEIRDRLNRFLATKEHLVETGEITRRTFDDYHTTCRRIGDAFVLNRPVDDLDVEDFEKMRANIGKAWGPVTFGNEVQRIRVIFKYAYDAALI